MTSTTATKPCVPLNVADSLARRIVDELSPACERIEIAGSVRRRKPRVHDIDLVAIPKPGDALFGEDASLPTRLDYCLDTLARVRRLRFVKCGPRAMTLEVPAVTGLRLEIWTATADTFGWIYCLRTGPADFTRRLVTPTDKGGLKPPYVAFRDGEVLIGGRAAPCPEETDLFDLLNIRHTPPEDRR